MARTIWEAEPCLALPQSSMQSLMTKELLREITAAVDIPVVAIGGINADNAVTLKGTGIAGIAVVGAIFASADIKAAAKELAEICDKIL